MGEQPLADARTADMDIPDGADRVAGLALLDITLLYSSTQTV